MGLSGFAGAGAQNALEDMIARALLQQREARAAEAQTFLQEQAIGDRMESARRFDIGQANDAADRTESRRLTDLQVARQAAADKRVADAEAIASAERDRDTNARENMQLIAGSVKPGSAQARQAIIGQLSRINPNAAAEGMLRLSPEEEEARDFAAWKRRTDYSDKVITKRQAANNDPPKMPATMAQTVAAAQTSLAALDRLEQLYSDEKVGPVAGRYNTMERGSPSLIGGLLPDAPEGFEDFAAESATLKNQIIQAITGAAVGVQEQKRILGQIPDVTDTPMNWRAKAAATKRNLQELMANQVRMGGGAAPVQPGASVTLRPGTRLRFDATGKQIQ